ncbi:cyclophilin-like domain-containing protein [Melanogaster broomeanus]|nr:cyclophilin-like domain-containing protein [Melanogaster broomeanus]
MALPTHGRVIVETTAGEIDIELWSKETPKACRNFIALALEGYYDGVIFHRIVPNFLVQTGDKTGTGAGGESFYGEPFEDEIHPRLRFSHRGLVAMANSGTKNTNDSQFFITLDRADELHGKHTLFGRVIGDTLYNVLKIGEMEIDDNERPIYPPKIKSIKIIENPFPDIVPRITAAEKRAQQRAREGAQREREEAERRRGAKKNVKLLSFGDDEGAAEGGEPVVFKKKDIVRPDLIDDPRASSIPLPAVLKPPPPQKAGKEDRDQSVEELSAPIKGKEKEKKTKDADVTTIREKHAQDKASTSDARRSEIEKMEAEIRKLTRRRNGDVDSDEEAERRKAKKPKSYLEEELAKYSKGRGLHKKGKGKKDEGQVLAALDKFRGMLHATSTSSWAADDDEGEGERDKDVTGEGGESKAGDGEDAGMEVDDDRGFMSHELYFAKDDGEETRKAERDYEVIDPRQRGARAREEERERKRATRGRNGPGRPRR